MADCFVESPLLRAVPGARHAFSTRVGGVSTGPFASMNPAHGRDDARAVTANRARLAEAAGLEGPWLQVRQVHGVRIVEAAAVTSNTEADGVIVRGPGPWAAVRTADCVPVLILALNARGQAEAAAAVHAGWRGAVAGIVGRALAQLGAPPAQLRVALGPAISARHFEVGPEVVDAARASLGGRAPPTRPGRRGRPHLDLPELVRLHLLSAGVAPEHIDVSGACTFRDADRFFSHRRQRGRCGHHLSLVGLVE